MEKDNRKPLVLHLANDFSGSKVYKNLVYELDLLQIPQVVYTAVRSKNLLDKNRLVFTNPQSNIIYRNILNLYTRVNFRYKIRKVVEDVTKNVELKIVDTIHAHTWYSDGAVAYFLFRKYKIPYIVTIRNTDLNLFYKYFVHLRHLGSKILVNAQKVIFISPLYMRRTKNLSLLRKNEKIFQKFSVIPNGVDSYWLKNLQERKKHIGEPPVLLFVGKFSKIKNAKRICLAIQQLNETGFTCHLRLVGSGGTEEKILREQFQNKDYIEFLGQIHKSSDLQEVYKTSDALVMPSISETFGLVYIEALSQGIPVIFTIDEGIDGMHSLQIGERVDAKKVDGIAESIRRLLNDYSSYSFDPQQIVCKHDWKKIALRYSKIYQEILDRQSVYDTLE